MNTSQLSIILNYLKYYSSKTVTQILGVTAQTLRNWDKEDKLKPAYVNSNEHVFNYSYYNNSLHKVTCICGYDKNEPHVVESTILTKAMCLLCGRLINLDSGIGQIPGLSIENIKRTLNGSYILPDGVIVLVKEDIEAYFNGTLIFYSGNNEIS